MLMIVLLIDIELKILMKKVIYQDLIKKMNIYLIKME